METGQDLKNANKATLQSAEEEVLQSAEEIVLGNNEEAVLQEKKQPVGVIRQVAKFPKWLCKTAYLAITLPLAVLVVFISTFTLWNGGTVSGFREGLVQFATQAEPIDYTYAFLALAVMFCVIAAITVIYRVFTSTISRSIMSVCGSRSDAAMQKCGEVIDLTFKKVFKQYTKIFYVIVTLSFIGLFVYAVLYWVPNQAKKTTPESIQLMMLKEPLVINSAAIIINNKVINGKAEIELLEDGRYLVSFENKVQDTDSSDNSSIESEVDSDGSVGEQSETKVDSDENAGEQSEVKVVVEDNDKQDQVQIIEQEIKQ